jgi:hypothetical protein
MPMYTRLSSVRDTWMDTRRDVRACAGQWSATCPSSGSSGRPSSAQRSSPPAIE